MAGQWHVIETLFVLWTKNLKKCEDDLYYHSQRFFKVNIHAMKE